MHAHTLKRHPARAPLRALILLRYRLQTPDPFLGIKRFRVRVEVASTLIVKHIRPPGTLAGRTCPGTSGGRSRDLARHLTR
jgi:hypothetical protein